jgi:hypothetical protein
MAGSFDPDGVLTFAAKPADAPIVHFDGPLAITFYGSRPELRVGRNEDMVLVVGSRGRGPGTFAMLAYDETIPKDAYPKVEVTYPASASGGTPIREPYELKRRC